MRTLSVATIGPAFAAIAVTVFSVNDVLMKFLSDSYALHQIVLLRSFMGLALTIGLMAPLAGGTHLLKTNRLGLHFVRGACVVFANMTFFLGLSVLPLADAVALFFVSPFLITIFGVIFLGETVGARRWSAIAIGLVGVLIVLRPGTQAFQLVAFLPILAAFGYAGLHILTRYMRDTENAVSMTFYIQVIFLVVCAILGFGIGDGRFEGTGPAMLDFLFRAWVWPEPWALAIMLILGAFASIAGYCISQAYRLGEAGLVAPFEYLALPLSILWGILVFGEWPDLLAWLGILLILGSGLYSVWRENQLSRSSKTPKSRLG